MRRYSPKQKTLIETNDYKIDDQNSAKAVKVFIYFKAFLLSSRSIFPGIEELRNPAVDS